MNQFRDQVWDYYHDHARSMPWREDPSPYWVVVSEVMLQQTQVSRVLVKFEEFIQRFGSFEELATASPAEVIGAWQGLGYNRRAMHLHKLAKMVAEEYGGELPRDPEELIKLPGIGAGTAGSIAAFAFNTPVVFIETNIRRVFIHHFFADKEGVHDKEILPLVEETLDWEHPREWYYALMDYGTRLAKTVPNPNRRSKHHVVQSKFEGSDRQIRGEILRQLLNRPKTNDDLFQVIGGEQERLTKILAQLLNEGMISESAGQYRLPE